jgi:hypothetical protein
MPRSGENPRELRVKAVTMLARYYLRSVAKRTLGAVPAFIFLVSLALFIAVLVPKFRDRLRESQPGSDGLLTLQIVGSVFEETRGPDGTATIAPVSGAAVEIGGYGTTSDPSGAYELKFGSPTLRAIPIVFRWGNHEVIERVDFPAGGGEIEKDFIFR